jgi:hypothetical protein
LMAIPRREVGSWGSSPTCPARVSFAGCVLPSGPSPCDGLSPPPSTMPDKQPQGRIAAFCPPGAWFSGRVLGSSVVPFPSFPVIASIPVYHDLVVPTVLDSRLGPFPSFLFGVSLAVYHYRAVPTAGAHWGLPSSLTLPFRHATACELRRIFTPSPLWVLSCGLRCPLKPSASAPSHFEAVPALQGARRPGGLPDALSTLRPPCSPPCGDSATDARLDTGGWLALTRRGLSPRQKRRAWLSATG